MKITIIGSGYVGLVTGACLGDLGHHVVCVDNNKEKIRMLKQGEVPFYEPGLKELVGINFNEGRLTFTDSIKEGVAHGHVIFITVGTPPKEDTGAADLSAVQTVSREIAESMTSYRVVVEKSTVPVRTGRMVADTISRHIAPGIEFDVASVPEFLREGSAIKDFLNPDRIVIGVTSDKAAGLLVKIFEPLNAPLLLTDIESAELIKHCANAFLAMKISFINAVAHICELSGADVGKVAMGIGLDHRIGKEFLKPGIGYGGSCFPKDVKAFIAISKKLGYEFKLLKEVEKINEFARNKAIDKLKMAFDDKLEGKTMAVLGLSFKPDTDDIRSSPALDIINKLREENVSVRAYDPKALDFARELGVDAHLCDDVYSAVTGVDAMIVATEWPEFRNLDLPRVKSIMNRPVVIDGRNLFEPFRLEAMGFEYYGMGRKNKPVINYDF
ncbi:MAG: UDP-glucose/GDP-mannose dehydrogenase family protein [Candidatus Eremiobacteraeota bacterium]|nr:UDP-glucose/GDP-mannose dehydrogenase family protein [Candidatus Eremiobacteraeota bacterium]